MAQNRRSQKKKASKQEGGETREQWTALRHVLADESVSSRTFRAVGGVAFLTIGVFFTLAGLDLGGRIGDALYMVLSKGFGVGYVLIPIAFFMSSTMFFEASQEERVGPLRLLSVLLFVLAGLGLINVALPGEAGLLGGWISNPLIALVDIPATIVFLCAFLIETLLVAFDAHPIDIYYSILAWKTKRDSEPQEETEPAITDVTAEDSEPAEPAPVPQEEYAEAEPPPEPAVEIKKMQEFEDDNNPLRAIQFAAPITYTPPPVALLSKNKGKPEVGDVKANTNIIKRTLLNFGIQVEMDEVSIGPTVTRYSMKPAEGVRLSKIVALQSNLELALAASPVRIEAPIPGKSLVGIEVPNVSRTTLGLAPIMSDSIFAQSDKPLLIALGRDISGTPLYTDLSRMPHLLIAGATGAGKSVTIHDLILSLLYRRSPHEMRFIMIDPKRVELTLYNSIPHLLTPVITDAKKAILALRWLAKEMERRYDILETEAVRDIASYHENVWTPAAQGGKRSSSGEKRAPEPMPYIVVIIDELADIMQTYPRELEAGIVRLAQMSRAVGIHLVLSTQRPSVKVITGLIKANIPARLALQVASQIDSRTILDMGGAEKLLGAGDMLFLSGEMSKPKRLQAPYVSESEVKQVVKYLAEAYEHLIPSEIQFAESADGGSGSFPISDDGGSDDDLYEEAKRSVMDASRASTSYLQRKLRIGYARAARLMDILEEKGVIGPADGAKPREVLQQGGTSSEESGGADQDAERA